MIEPGAPHEVVLGRAARSGAWSLVRFDIVLAPAEREPASGR